MRDETVWGPLGFQAGEIEEERERPLLFRVPVVEDERRGDGACPRDLVWGYSRGQMRPRPVSSSFGIIAEGG